MKRFPRIHSALALLSICLAAADTYSFYNPTQGRWLSRDPVDEAGGNNLYAVVANRIVDVYDILGLETFRFGFYGLGSVDNFGTKS
jgi:hypothetical protein